MNEQLFLSNIRGVLIRLEETIIFALIERCQFRANPRVYDTREFSESTGALSLMHFLLLETEKTQAKMRRYTSPDEHPFCRDLPSPILPELRYDESPLHPNTINLNPQLLGTYQTEMVPFLCEPGDDQQYGSSCVADVTCLQALSKRIHYGMFVAESKYQSGQSLYQGLIKAEDRDGIMAALTDQAVEDQVARRVAAKTRTYAAELMANNGNAANPRVHPDRFAEVYRRWVIPLTKDVELFYLLNRLSDEPTAR